MTALLLPLRASLSAEALIIAERPWLHAAEAITFAAMMFVAAFAWSLT